MAETPPDDNDTYVNTGTRYYSEYRREHIRWPNVVNDLSRFVEIVRQLGPGESALFVDRYGHNIDTQVRRHVKPCEPYRDTFGDHMELFLEEQTGKKVNVGGHIMDGRIDAGGFEHDLDSFGYLVTVIQ